MGQKVVGCWADLSVVVVVIGFDFFRFGFCGWLQTKIVLGGEGVLTGAAGVPSFPFFEKLWLKGGTEPTGLLRY